MNDLVNRDEMHPGPGVTTIWLRRKWNWTRRHWIPGDLCHGDQSVLGATPKNHRTTSAPSKKFVTLFITDATVLNSTRRRVKSRHLRLSNWLKHVNNNSDFYSAFLSTQRGFTGNKRQTEQNKKKADKTNKREHKERKTNWGSVMSRIGLPTL